MTPTPHSTEAKVDRRAKVKAAIAAINARSAGEVRHFTCISGGDDVPLFRHLVVELFADGRGSAHRVLTSAHTMRDLAKQLGVS